MNVLIHQPAGIGDIIFCQKIAKKLIANGDFVFWPVEPQINWLTKHLNTVCTKDFATGLIIHKHLMLDGAHYNYPGSKIMQAKYILANESYEDYLDYFIPARWLENENSVYTEVLKGYEGPYRLVCDTYGTPDINGNVAEINIKVTNDMPNIYLRMIPGYSLFDWIKVIENAQEVFCTDSAITFLVEKFNNKATKLVCYSRRPTTDEIDYLYKKNWIYVT